MQAKARGTSKLKLAVQASRHLYKKNIYLCCTKFAENQILQNIFSPERKYQLFFLIKTSIP
jgi:hypothetical protein